jgi:hypothetical protein
MGARPVARAAIEGRRPRGVRARRGAAARRARAVRAGQRRRRELHGLQGRRRGRGAAAPRVEGGARPPRLRGHRRPAHDAGGGGPAARLHDQRDRLGPAVDRSTWIPFDGRADLAAGVLRAVDARTFGDDSLRVLRAVQFAARFEFALDPGTFEICRRLPLDDLPAERLWGEIEKLLLQAPTAVEGLRPGARPRGRRAPVPRDARAHRLPAGTRVAPRRGRLDPHADGDRPGAAAARRARSPAPGRADARRRLPRSRQAGHDGVPSDGRIRSIDHEQAGVARRRRCSIA